MIFFLVVVARSLQDMHDVALRRSTFQTYDEKHFVVPQKTKRNKCPILEQKKVGVSTFHDPSFQKVSPQIGNHFSQTGIVVVTTCVGIYTRR